MQANLRPHTFWISDALILSIILCTLYGLWLGSYPLFIPDEGRYAEIAREMLAHHDWITPRLNGIAFLDKPILYYWLQAISMSLFGINEWAIRLFPALFGILGCLITYFCGRILFNRTTGLLAALILGTSPLYFIGAHYANLDLEVAVWISASLLFFITALQSNHNNIRSPLLIASYVTAALAFLTKGLIGIAFPGLIISTWILLTRQFSLLRHIHLVKGSLFFLAITLPWYILVQLANPNFFHYFFITQHIARFLSHGEFNNQTIYWFYLPVLFLGLFPWSMYFIDSLYQSIKNYLKNKQSHHIELFLLLWIGIIFIFFSIPQAKITTYILPIFPPAALLSARYLTLSLNKLPSKRYYGMMVATLILAGIFLFLIKHPIKPLTSAFTPYLIILSSILLITAALAFLFRKKALSAHITLYLISNAICLLTLSHGAEYLNTSSNKLLVTKLASSLQKNDMIVHYHHFYQDIPLYLQRRISIVSNWQSPQIARKDNWQRELWYGIPFQKIYPFLMDEQTFWQEWQGSKRIFVFLKKNQIKIFSQKTPAYHFINENEDTLLISNK